jgi:predicted Rossmann fold flavoprotein
VVTTPRVSDFDVVVIGAGAAGMMCAAVAGGRGRRVLLVDHSDKLGEKIRISGGGRCNFTNIHTRPEAFISRNPHFCRSTLARYTPRDFLDLVERHRIAYHEKTLGQLFCDDSSGRIIEMLVSECAAGGVEWARPVAVERILAVDHGSARFEVATSQGVFRSRALVIATGGLSIPKTGATPFGYRVAEQFGVAVVPPQPGLVPFAAPPEWLERFGELSGTSFDAIASVADAPPRMRLPQFREAALVTHRGLSGPAILQVSSYWQLAGARGAVALDLLPDMSAAQLRDWLAAHRHDSQGVAALLAERLPRRFAASFAQAHGWLGPAAALSNAAFEAIAQTLKDWRIQPSGTLGYAKAEVTLGGVDTGALSQQTMEARAVPGLYFIGEVVDVTGWLGGYNFQWAWASAHAAGTAL